MKNNLVTTIGLRSECYVLEVDGEVISEHRRFVDALRTALQLKQVAPQSNVKVLDSEPRDSGFAAQMWWYGEPRRYLVPGAPRLGEGAFTPGGRLTSSQ
jgi:hypothetical protein